MADLNTRRLLAQYRRAIREPDEFIKYAMDDDNPRIWYILIRNIAGDKDEYIGGEFIFRMDLPNNFPYSPPAFFAQTPNGLYDLHQRCCISIGEFHADDYCASLGACGFARELANGMMNWKQMGGGINLIHTNEKTKKELSAKSIEYNIKNNEKILLMISEHYEIYSKKWDLSKIPHEMQVKLELIQP